MIVTRVFAVHTDFGRETYRTLMVTDDEESRRFISLFPKVASPIGDRWHPPSFVFNETAGVTPDVVHLWHPNLPVLTRRARELLGDEPTRCGELLPIEAEGQSMWIWHVTQRADCLDASKSMVPVHGAMSLVFVPDQLPAGPLFIVDYRRMRGRMFLVERPEHRSHLRDLFETRQLTGLAFVEVWSEDNGPILYDPMTA